jgi:hypothetical protein
MDSESEYRVIDLDPLTVASLTDLDGFSFLFCSVLPDNFLVKLLFTFKVVTLVKLVFVVTLSSICQNQEHYYLSIFSYPHQLKLLKPNVVK